MEELMPAWGRWGYEKGMKEGMESVVLNMLREGADPALLMKVTGWSEEKITELKKQIH